MKNKKVKILAGTLLSISLLFSAGFVFAKPQSHTLPEIVLAEGEEEPVDSGSDVHPEEQPTEEEVPTPKEEESSSEQSEQSSNVSSKSIFKAIYYMFRDAFNDLRAHLKKWFKIK